MTVTIKAPEIQSDESPREIIGQDFQSVGDLPIKGGWGYSEEDAVIIDKNDPIWPQEGGKDFFSIEQIFVEKRIYEELIIFRDPNDRYLGITWDILKQELMKSNEKTYDVLTFEVKALRSVDWEMLKTEWDKNSSSASFDRKSHLEKHEQLTVSYVTKYFFDITDFF